MPRITSKETYVEFKAGRSSAEQPHIQKLYFNDTITSGTFKLRVNGYLTGAITFSATEATLITNVDNALDALSNLSASQIALTGTDVQDMTLTGNANEYHRIIVDADSQALVGNTTTNPDLTTEVTQVGGAWTALSADMSEFQYEESAETTDVTGLSEEEQEVLVTKSSCSYSLSLYEANQSWAYQIHQGQEGRIRVFNQGKVSGKKYLEMECLIESVSGNTPDHDVLEKEVSGMRQGAWISPPDSIW